MRNRLLNAIPANALDRLRPHLQLVELARGSTIEMPGAPVRFAHFVEEGVVSIAMSVGGSRFELGLTGREGMLGIPALLGTNVAQYSAVVVLACKAHSVPVKVFQGVMREQPSVAGIVVRFMQAQVAQLAHNSFANSRLNALERVGRWILMARDRNDSDTLMISQSTLSNALGLHRPRVSEVFHKLEGEGAIRSRRVSLMITDREKLETIVGPSYGPAERAYEMLIGAGK